MKFHGGRKALTRYLGEDRQAWEKYDACVLVRKRASGATILIDQGEADQFLGQELRPELLKSACDASG